MTTDIRQFSDCNMHKTGKRSSWFGGSSLRPSAFSAVRISKRNLGPSSTNYYFIRQVKSTFQTCSNGGVHEAIDYRHSSPDPFGFGLSPGRTARAAQIGRQIGGRNLAGNAKSRRLRIAPGFQDQEES